MASTKTLSKTISSRMRLPTVSALKPKNPWPDSQGSIGCLLCPMGRNKCWEAVGSAGALSKGNLFKEIKVLLESRHEHLNEGESVPRAILFEVYMIGRNESFARPTILFCCERKPPRQRAMKLVRESLVLVQYPGVQLGDCSRPPGLTCQPVPLFDPISEEDDPSSVRRFNSGVLYRPPIKSLFGVPVYVQLSHGHLRAATIGGFICLDDTIVGLSVRHVLEKDQAELNPEDFGTEMEFSLEYDDFEEDEDGEGDSDFVMMTSTGSISPNRLDSDDSVPSIRTDVLKNTDIEENLRSESGASNLMIPSQLNEGREALGHALIISVPNESENSDWAIIGLLPPFGLDLESLKKCVDGQPGAIRVTCIVGTAHSKAAVLILTGSNGVIRGAISGNLSFVQLAGSTAFQEMWTVRLEGPLLPGDCGSWVLDADSGALYGHIVAGDPGTSVAYITPAKQILREIENKTGSTVTFPSSESVMRYFASSTDLTAKNLDEEMVGYTPVAESLGFSAYEQSTGGMEIRPKTDNNEDVKKFESEPPDKYKLEDLLESFMPAGVKVEDTDSDVSNIVQLPLRRKRTKTGCLPCRSRRIKCGEERPVCNNCVRSFPPRKCEWYNQRVVFKGPLNDYRPDALGFQLHPHSGQNEPALVPLVPKPPTSKPDSIDLQTAQLKPADEIYDDDLWDVSDDDTVFDTDLALLSDSYQHLEKNDVGIVVALQARQEETRSFTSFLDQSGSLDTYMPSPTSSPLKDIITARIFCHFVNAVAPTLSMYERHPADPSLMFQAPPIPKSHQHIWTYTMPTLALMNPGLLHSILAVGSLHIGLLQNGSLTASLKHYDIALRRVAKVVSLQHRRQAPATLASCLLLGWYEFMCADRQKWSNHLQGTHMLLQEVEFAKIERYKKSVRGAQSSPLDWVDSSPTNVQVATLGELKEDLIRMFLGEKPDERDPSTTAIKDDEKYTQRDLELHELQRDMFWWFCKQDMVQSILGGTRLTLPFKSWGRCLPRAPIGRITAIYGTNDHLILLLGRMADFASRDLKRKELSAQKYGGWRPPPNLRGPATTFTAATEPSQDLEEKYSAIEADARQAEGEWQEIRNAFPTLEGCFGEDFAALGPEFSDPIQTPFGPSKVYRTYGVAGIWLNFYMGLIIAYRAHPSMPPAALMAAGIAARQTSIFANEIGCIAAGICPGLSRSTKVIPRIAAALIESSVALFVAGIQYQDAAQRLWLIQQFSDIARLTGFKTAISFAKGCEASWIKNAEAGLGPPYHRPTDNSGSEDLSLSLGPVFDNTPANDANKLILSRAARVHYALGILGVDEDFEKLDLGRLE